MTGSSIKQILGAVTAYADANGMTASEVLSEVRGHEEFPKGKRGRPRKEQVEEASPQVSKRPRGRPPAGATWSEDRQMYLDSHGNEYVKVDTPPTTRRRGRPPNGTTWDEASQSYVTQSGETYQKVEKVPSGRPRGRPRTSEPKVASNRPKGRPPKGKMWSEEQGEYVDAE